MLSDQCMTTVWFLGLQFSYIYADVIYQKAENFAVSGVPEEILSDRVAVSARHCSQLCGVQSECTAASYISATSQCLLLASSVLRLTAQSGTTAYVTMPQGELYIIGILS